MTPQQFVAKWSKIQQKETAVSQSHFNDLCQLVGHRHPMQDFFFEAPFGRKPVTSARYFYNLITYIHRNPQKHGLVNDFRDWPYSSYDAILSAKPTRVRRTAVLDWFGGADGFSEAHQADADERLIYHLIDDD